MNFETTVGLVVHIEMQTNSKAYSPSPVQYGAEQNTNTNVIDWGYPGVLPEINKGALEFGMRASLGYMKIETTNMLCVWKIWNDCAYSKLYVCPRKFGDI